MYKQESGDSTNEKVLANNTVNVANNAGDNQPKWWLEFWPAMITNKGI